MAALLGADLEQARGICAEAAQGEVVEAANDNGGGQVVISGHRAAVERAVEMAKAAGVKRAMLLPVSAPFHCSLMAPAAEAMAEALATSSLIAPSVPLIANIAAAKATDPDEIRELLVRQVTGTVRWRESVLACIGMGVDSFVELGAGRVLSGLVRRIAPDARSASAGTPAEIEALLKIL
jgi:[acyl-carrier-protein] S-malonyltransferase